MSILQKAIQTAPESPATDLPIIRQAIPKVYDFKSERITLKTKVEPLEPIVRIAGSTFAVKGDISFISGPPKSGKTNVCAAMLASVFHAGMDTTGELLSIESAPAGKKTVVYIDTEQPKPYTQGMIRKIMDIAGLSKEPENLMVLNLRELTAQERRSYLEQLFNHLTDEHLYFIDGITDFIASVNDETESAEFINYLMKMSSVKRIPVICVMHENLGTGKLRGHLGSEAERKCGGSIGIRKDREKQVHWIEAKLLRGTTDFENVYFQWDVDLKRFTLADDAVHTIMRKEVKKDREELKKEKLQRLMRDAFGPEKSITKKLLTDRIQAINGMSQKTAGRNIADAMDMELLQYNTETTQFTLNNG